MNGVGQLVELMIGRRGDRRRARRAPMIADDLAARLGDVDARWPLLSGSATAEKPIFILSAGWRSGSTLLQRMVMEDRSVLIWGEPYGRARIVQSLADQWRGFTQDWPKPESIAAETLPRTSGAWIANLYPDVAALRSSQVAYLQRLLRAPAQQRGRPRWGLKEVRLTSAHAIYLHWLFPDAKFVFLYRDPFRAYASYKPFRSWFRAWPDQPVLTPGAFGRMWKEMVEDFMANHGRVGGLLLRYEDLDDRVSELRTYLDLDVAAPRDLEVVRGSRKHGNIQVSPLERMILARAVSPTRRSAGYR